MRRGDDDAAVARVKLTAVRQPVLDVGEAQRASQGDVADSAARERVIDGIDLPFDGLKLCGAVTPVDKQQLLTRREQTADPLELNPAARALGVDDRDAGDRDGDVVDVGAAATGDSSVVKEEHSVAVEVAVQLDGGRPFSLGSLAPRDGCGWLAGPGGDDGAEPAVLGARVRIPTGLPALVLTLGAGSGRDRFSGRGGGSSHQAMSPRGH